MANEPKPSYDTPQNITNARVSIMHWIEQNCQLRSLEYQLWTANGLLVRVKGKTNWKVKGQMLRALADRLTWSNALNIEYRETWASHKEISGMYLKAINELIKEGGLLIREIQ